MPYDFSGWASKNDLKCSDGRIIRRNAFRVNDRTRVPLVWNHRHNSPEDVLGHADLENRNEGVYAYCSFNDTPNGRNAKAQVEHGDVTALSIWANQLRQEGNEVVHGIIREVSLVLAGANPGAFIESVMAHGEPMDDYDSEGIFYVDKCGISIHHAEDDETGEDQKSAKKKPEEKSQKTDSGKTVKEVYDTFNDEQKAVVGIIAAQLVADKTKKKDDEQSSEKSKKEDTEMKHNIFDNDSRPRATLSHSDVQSIFNDAKRIGSLKETIKRHLEDGGILAHALDTTGMDKAKGKQTYGFNDADMLFPEYKALTDKPEWISREMSWVQKVMSEVHHTPFSRIKSVYADITEDDARAKGYIKGKQKKTEVFTLLKRTTSPTTVYKLQKMDRDDIIDITDFDVVAWIRAEMRMMLDEEIARAILLGDGRDPSSDDHIPEEHVRPIAKDVPLYNVTVTVNVDTAAKSDAIASETIDTIVRSRKDYKGTGTPTLFTTEDALTEMLLLKDGIGHRLYKTEAELATALRVKEIVTVEPMSGYTIDKDAQKLPLIGIIVNLTDYNVGADKGGAVSMFDDFDLDFNKYTYLIETRISGALVKPFSAITVLLNKGVLGAA